MLKVQTDFQNQKFRSEKASLSPEELDKRISELTENNKITDEAINKKFRDKYNSDEIPN